MILVSNIQPINRDPFIFGMDAHECNPSCSFTTHAKTTLVPAQNDTKDEHYVTFGFGWVICVRC